MGVDFYCPTEIVFSRDGPEGLTRRLSKSAREVIVLTGHSSAQKSGKLSSLVSAMASAALAVRIVDGVDSNPTAENINSLREAFEDAFGQAIVSLGGGSVHDAARLLNLLSSQNISLREASVQESGHTRIERPGRDLYTVPTISGTGAEVSPAALVRLGNEKRIIFSRMLFPKMAYVDPFFLFCRDPNLVGAVGIDAFFQGLEAYVSSASSDWSDTFALSAISLAAQNLPRLVADPEDNEAAMKVAAASIQGLLAVTTAGVGGIHALSDALSGVFGSGHGVALAAVAPAVISFNDAVVEERFSTVAAMLEPAQENTLRLGLPEALERFCQKLGISRLVERERERIRLISRREFIQLSLNPDMATNPRDMTEEDIGKTYDLLVGAT